MKKRFFNLDLMRFFGLLFIIFNHALNTVWDATNFNFWLNTTLVNRIFFLLGYTLCRLGVPLFLMITGALILNKKFEKKEDILRFYKHNLGNLIIAVVIWNFLYYIFNLFYYNNEFSIKDLIYILLFMKNSPMPHMWYMSMIIGMYFVLPYISILVKKLNFKEILIPLLLTVLAFYIIPNFKTFLTFLGFEGTNIRSIIDFTYLGGTYGIYIIMGYYVYNNKILNNVKNRYLVIGLIIGILSTMSFQMIGYLHHSSYIIYYNFIGVLFSGIILFELLRRNEFCNSERIRNSINQISKFSLGIYFVHRPILFLFKKYFILNYNDFINILIYYLCSILISYIIVWIFSKLKIFKNYLFLVKD